MMQKMQACNDGSVGRISYLEWVIDGAMIVLLRLVFSATAVRSITSLLAGHFIFESAMVVDLRYFWFPFFPCYGLRQDFHANILVFCIY